MRSRFPVNQHRNVLCKPSEEHQKIAGPHGQNPRKSELASTARHQKSGIILYIIHIIYIYMIYDVYTYIYILYYVYIYIYTYIYGVYIYDV